MPEKYILRAAPSGSAPRPCAFYLSKQGCRNAANCKFFHGTAEEAAAAAADVSDSSSIVSSESETPPVAPVKSKKRKQTSSDTAAVSEVIPAPQKRKQTSASMFAAPKTGTPASDKKSEKKKKQKKQKTSDAQLPHLDDGSNPFVLSIDTNAPAEQEQPQLTPKKAKLNKTKPKTPKAAPVAAPIPANTNKAKPKIPKAAPAAAPTPANTPVGEIPSFRKLKLPIAPFSLPESSGDDEPQQNQLAPSPTKVDPPRAQHAHPLPISHPDGRKRKDSVIATHANTRYAGSYDFEQMKNADATPGAESWIKAKPYGKWCENNPAAIAIDCEMCQTKNPVTGETNNKALCRISIVNAVDPDEVLLDTLVKPAWPVTDYRDRINGIKEEHLKNVQFTLLHAQAFMLALCSEETVIIGHALHNDLVAIKMEHHCNVDSALLYSVKDEPGATPSLKDLAMDVMGKPMPNTHDSVNDARTSLLCLLPYLEKGGKVEPIARHYPKRRKSSVGNGMILFVHRIPKFCKPEHIKQMLAAQTRVEPKEVGAIEFGASTGKVNAVFSSAEDARLAFDNLKGAEVPDKTGRMQKKVYLRNGDYVQIRKMHGPKRIPLTS